MNRLSQNDSSIMKHKGNVIITDQSEKEVDLDERFRKMKNST